MIDVLAASKYIYPCISSHGGHHPFRGTQLAGALKKRIAGHQVKGQWEPTEARKVRPIWCMIATQCRPTYITAFGVLPLFVDARKLDHEPIMQTPITAAFRGGCYLLN